MRLFFSSTHLQWTTMGPASGGLQDLTRRRKARMGVGYSGTPWSGQAMNWNCLTSLFSLEPFYRRVRDRGKGVSLSVVERSHTVKCNWLPFKKETSHAGNKCFEQVKVTLFDERELKFYS